MNAFTAAKATKAYTNVGIESSVMGADPHKLISLLFQGALLAIARAKDGMSRKDISAKGAAISQAMLIISEGLQASLDKKVGGDLALSLDQLYSYMGSRLLQANLKDDIAILDEVARLLVELKGAWDAIRPEVTGSSATVPQTAPVSPSPNKQPALVYGRG